MNRETLTEYAQLMEEYNLASLEIEEEGCRVKLERHPKPPKGHPGPMPPFCPPPGGHPPMGEEGMPPGRAPYAAPSAQEGYAPVQYGHSGMDGAKSESAPESTGETITSPMVGVYYQAPAENAEPYVKEGDTVKKGDTLCIIEAMKLMNEITAERGGRIAAVLAENGQVVEYGTPLFVIE